MTVSCFFSGNGYQVPQESITKNKLRTAKIWMDDYFNLSESFIHPGKDIKAGNIDKVVN